MIDEFKSVLQQCSEKFINFVQTANALLLLNAYFFKLPHNYLSPMIYLMLLYLLN